VVAEYISIHDGKNLRVSMLTWVIDLSVLLWSVEIINAGTTREIVVGLHRRNKFSIDPTRYGLVKAKIGVA